MHTRVTAKLRAEIASHSVSSPIKDSEAREMPYLQAVVREGLRMFPPVVGLMSKEVPPEGDMIHGKFVPGGTKIGFGAWGIFRNQEFWGPDADQFRPERWIENSPEKVKEMDYTLELVFGWGRYQCLGKNLAMMELNKIFVQVSIHIICRDKANAAQLLRNFDFNIVNPLNPVKSVCHGIFFQSEMWITAFERD